MKHVKPKYLGRFLVLIAGIGSYGLAKAHGDEHHEAAPAQQAKATLGSTVDQQTPATAEGIWQAIDLKTAELEQTIQGGALGDVHHLAFAVRDLVAALPQHSQALSAERQGKVKGGVKFVATLADRLDASGDANDKAGAQANYEKLMKVLVGLRANYPAANAK